MDTNGSEATWIGDGYKKTGNDYAARYSTPEYAKYSRGFKDSPASVMSRDAIFLTEVEKKLAAWESRYVEATEKLRYMKVLYENAGSVSLNDYNRTDETVISEGNFQSNGFLGLHSTDEKNIEKTSGDTEYRNQASSNADRVVPAKSGKHSNGNPLEIRVKINVNTSEMAEQSPMYTVTSVKIPSEQNPTLHDAIDKNNRDANDQNQFFESAEGGTTNFLYTDFMENSETDRTNRIRKEHLTEDEYPRRQHPCQQHLVEYSKSLQDEMEEELRKSAESSRLEDQNTLNPDILKSSRQHDSNGLALHVNLSESMETVQTATRNKKLRSKQRRVSSKTALKSIDDTTGSIVKRKRKKRGGVKTSNSRCTTATRDTGISENKKDFRSRKQRGPSTISRLQQSQNRRQDVATKTENCKSEVVEIYHNTAVKSGSLSVVSSKHSKVMESRVRGFNGTSKLDQPWRTKGSYRLVEDDDQAEGACDHIEEQKSGEPNEPNEPMENFENGYEDSQENLLEASDFRSGEPNTANYQADCSATRSENKAANAYEHPHRRHNRQSPQNSSSPCYDLVSSRNYESPTVSSRMKQVHKSYFNRFNFKNIPFVVGTSITPSYNLGLNIQEALNLMKTRQGLSGGVPPLIISHVSKVMKPGSRMFECMRDENETSRLDERIAPGNATFREISKVQPGGLTEEKISRSVTKGGFHLKTPRLSFIRDTETLYETRPGVNPKICLSMKSNLQKNGESKAQLTQSTLLRQRQEEINSGDAQPIKWQNVTQNTKGIREVLLNFHDQYEAMISKFERLQDQAKKTSDKSLDKEIAVLEKELNEKEEEINAVAGLYQEVMILKEQMRMLHERNSLVCVTTESPRGPTSPNFAFRGQTTSPIRTINIYRRGGSFNNPGLPASTKLAGLLRQIKTFQKQLKSTT